MICYDFQCIPMPCHATPCNVIACKTKPFNAMQRHTTRCNTIQCHTKYVALLPKLAHDCSYHVQLFQRNQLTQSMSHCTQNWNMTIATIYHHTIVSFCREIFHIAPKMAHDHCFHIPSLSSRVTSN